MNVNRILRTLASKQADKDSEALPKASTHRVRSVSESLREYKPQGYYLYFCYHDKSLYEVCSACKRTKREAERNLRSL